MKTMRHALIALLGCICLLDACSEDGSATTSGDGGSAVTSGSSGNTAAATCT